MPDAPPLLTATAPGALDGGPDGYRLAPWFAVRIAGLPVVALERLRFTGTWELLDEVRAASAWLAAEGAALSDALYAVIGAHPGSPVKPLLVALRRSVFTDRPPDRRTLAAPVLAPLPDGLAERILAWSAARQRREAARARLPELLATETGEKTAALRRAVAIPEFRRGLALASPDLSASLDAWLSTPESTPPARQLRTRLAKYLARVAAKTSPYATFSVSGFGRWTGSGPAVAPTGELDYVVVAELEHRVQSGLWQLCTQRPEVRERVRLRVNPTAVDDGERIWFLGAGGGEPLTSVRAGAALRRLLELVRAAPELPVCRLRERLPDTGPVLDRLVGAGLLEPVAPYRDQDEDPLGALSAWLADEMPGGEPGREALLPPLGRLRAALRGAAAGEDHAAHAARIGQVRTAVAECAEALAGRPLPLPDKNLVMETALLRRPATDCALPAWRAAGADLAAWRGFLGLFDPDLPVKLAAAAYFRARYGTGAAVPLLEFYRAVHAGESASTPLPPGTAERQVLAGLVRERLAAHPTTLRRSPLPRLRELGRLRQAAWDALGADPQASDPVVRVAPATVAAITAGWPRFVTAPESVCCYVQPLPGGQRPGLVLNTVTTGYGRGLTRLWRLLRAAGGRPPPVADLRAPVAGEVVLAECRGALRAGVNVRPATAEVALDYPGTGEPDLPALPPTRLTVGWDPGTERLALRDPAGRSVRPLHLGMLAEYWLPPALRFLVRVFGEPAIAMAPGWAFRPATRTPALGAVQPWPRLEVGRVVVARACWRLRAGTFPVPAKGEAGTDYLLRLAGWLAEHGVPRRFFARVVALDPGAADGGMLGKARKPFYIDVTNGFLLDELARAAAAAPPEALMVLEEVLPDLAGAPAYGTGGRRVTEYVVQLSGTGKDPDHSG